MRIFKLLSTTLAVLCFSSDLLSDITFYGKINTSYESTDKNSKTDTDFKNNASRLGVKGKFDINDGLKISFQIENEIDPLDGRFRADGEKLFKEIMDAYELGFKPTRKQRLPEKILRRLGHHPYRAKQPNGWSDHSEDWISPELLIRRLFFADRSYSFIKPENDNKSY